MIQYLKFIRLKFVFVTSFFLFFNDIVFAQSIIIYPELELYYATVETEKIDSTYHKALILHESLGTKDMYPACSNKEIEGRYKQVINFSADDNEQLITKTDRLLELSFDAAEEGETNIELKALSEAFSLSFWNEPRNYHRAFNIAVRLENRLGQLTDEQYPYRRADYFKIGEAYYLFKDYTKSISLFKNALSEESLSFTDCANLDARKIIGICYANVNRMDSSDYYFLSTLKSNDIVMNRPLYNAYALSHLACNSMMRGESDKALALSAAVLPLMKESGDYGHVAGMFFCRGNSYFNKGEYDKVGVFADSVLMYANKDNYNRNKRKKQAFTLYTQYYSVTGSARMVKIYGDSLVRIYKQEETEFTSEYIRDAQQKAKDDEIALMNLELKKKHNGLLASFIVISCFVIALVFIITLYRHKREAYRLLVRKNMQWADQEDADYLQTGSNEHKPERSSADDIILMKEIQRIIVTEKGYADSSLTLNTLAEKINVNRSYISSAINKTTGKNFNAYINEFRIKEAIKQLSDKKSFSLTIDEIAFRSGFTNRQSFYESFKKITGLSPTGFRKNFGKN